MQEKESTVPARKPRLAIRVSQTSLSFSVPDTNEKYRIEHKPYGIKSGMSIAANLREAFRSEQWLKEGRWESALIMADAPAMMIPTEEFDQNTCGELYRHTFTDSGKGTIMYNVLPALNTIAVYEVSKDLKLVIDDNIGDATWIHLCTPVWNYLHKKSFIGTRQKLYAYFHDKKLEVFSYTQNRFKFCNTFPVTNADDATYFLLYIWRQLGFDQKHDELHIAGEFPELDAATGELRKYLRNAFITRPSADFNRNPIAQMSELPYDLKTLYIKGL